MKRFWLQRTLAAALLLSGSGSLLAQNPTGTLAGRVTAGDEAMPGVTVTVTSPALQGTRSAVTGASGDFLIPLLPAGDYQVSFELESFQPQRQAVVINAAQQTNVAIELAPGALTEVIEVVGTADRISSAPGAAVTMPIEQVEELPMERNIRETVLLTPGVTANGPNNNLVINGAMSYESLYLVNGVVLNENLRGQPLDLFIEDAIDETTVSSTGISAEYGRFAGGVVNVLTKSGGNNFSGSLRSNFTNETWVAKTPITTAERIDDVNPRYEATLGGRVVRDRLWFFAAGRTFETEGSAQTAITNFPFATGREQQRLEGKLTGSLTPSHRVIGTYLQIEDTQIGNVFPSLARTGDLNTIDDRETPQELAAFNYTGNFTSNLFGELQYSERHFTFAGSGGDSSDRILGTFIEGPDLVRINAPTFCGVCTDEQRDNENILGKLSWFLSTDRAGSHEIVGGYDRFTDIRLSNNFQTASNYRVFSSGTIYAPLQNPIPIFLEDTAITYDPVLQASLGTDFVTNSIYLNDRWRVNDQLSLNIGVRYDVNDGVDAAGNTVADDSKISPRLGLTYDFTGRGDILLHAAAGDYVTGLANNIADSTSPAGTPAVFAWYYGGPPINGPGQPLVDAHEALRRLFAWFDSVGGIANRDPAIFDGANIPGGTVQFVPGGLKSPSTREYSLGLSAPLGGRGAMRVDYVHREAQDFYIARTDLSTGRVTTPNGTFDLQVTGNDEDDLLERTYDGLHFLGDYRHDRLSVGLGYTLSRTYGNVTGETGPAGPTISGALVRPEYTDPSWNFPKGNLPSDQLHRARLWASYRLLESGRHSLGVSLLQSYDSGNPYPAAGSIVIRPFVNNGVNPGYVSPPTSVTYVFTDRDAFHTDDITSTSLSLNYALNVDLGNTSVEIFLQPEVINVFDENGIAVSQFVDQTVLTAANPGQGLATFNPFTQEPVEGVHWRRGPRFGQANSIDAYQTPRTFRFSVGVRF